jgi:flagellar biosynthetic protein FliQ
MEVAQVMQYFVAAVMVAVKIATPLLLAAVIVGLCVSLFQALTQINEGTLAFIPKILVMALVLWFTLPWVVRELVSFTTQVFVAAAGASR